LNPQDCTVILAKLPSRTDYVDEVYRTLLDAISDGTLAPGTRVTQEDLAERLSVSRSPVLQALRLLKKDGLLEDAPGRGLLVTKLEPLRVGQLYRVRGALDALAAQLAAECRVEIAATLISAGRQAAAAGDVRAMIEADTAFHRAIYVASGNPYVVESGSLHWIHLRRVMGAVLMHGESRAGIWDEHEAICAAIRAGDGVLAARLSEDHANSARQSLVSSLELALRRPPHAA
jgi:DNA-binding GntR family transcriptional regulator